MVLQGRRRLSNLGSHFFKLLLKLVIDATKGARWLARVLFRPSNNYVLCCVEVGSMIGRVTNARRVVGRFSNFFFCRVCVEVGGFHQISHTTIEGLYCIKACGTKSYDTFMYLKNRPGHTQTPYKAYGCG